METIWSKRGIFYYWGTLIFWFIILIYYQISEVNRVDTVYMVIFRWNNGVNGKYNNSKYYSTYCTGRDILVGVVRC